MSCFFFLICYTETLQIVQTHLFLWPLHISWISIHPLCNLGMAVRKLHIPGKKKVFAYLYRLGLLMHIIIKVLQSTGQSDISFGQPMRARVGIPYRYLKPTLPHRLFLPPLSSLLFTVLRWYFYCGTFVYCYVMFHICFSFFFLVFFFDNYVSWLYIFSLVWETEFPPFWGRSCQLCLPSVHFVTTLLHLSFHLVLGVGGLMWIWLFWLFYIAKLFSYQ